MKSEEEFENQEITTSRAEVAIAICETIRDVAKGMSPNEAKAFTAFAKCFGAAIMSKLFDEEPETLEVE